MASPLLSLFTGRGSRRAVETVIPSRTFADVVLPAETRRTLDEASPSPHLPKMSW